MLLIVGKHAVQRKEQKELARRKLAESKEVEELIADLAFMIEVYEKR